MKQFTLNYIRRYSQTKSNRVYGPSPNAGGHEGGYKLFRNLTFFVAFPVIGLAAFNSYLIKKNTPHHREPFVPYEYLRLRSKRFPWGEGQRSLFHNPEVNPLPDGYEEPEEK